MSIKPELTVRAHQERPQMAERLNLSLYPALKLRLLMGGSALNPYQAVQTVTPDAIPSFSDRNYSPYSSASLRERNREWQSSTKSFDEQKNEWITETTSLLSRKKDYFNTPEGDTWKQFFNKLGGLNLDVENISTQAVSRLYDRYFSGDETDSQMKQFAQDVLEIYTTNGTIDNDGLTKASSVISWTSKMFGEISSEAITHLVMGEAALKDPSLKQKLIQLASESRNGKLRINELDDYEIKTLSHISQAHPPRRETREQKTGYFTPPHLEYIGRKPIREFPDKETALDNFKPENVAEGLQEKGLYTNIPLNTLSQQIKLEQDELQRNFDRHGITSDFMRELAAKVISRYDQFVKDTYGVTLPEVQGLYLRPITGLTSEYYNVNENAIAFVQSSHPVIHLNMNAIERIAHQRGIRNFWNGLPKQTMGELISEALIETVAHEYTHVIADHAFWKQNENFKVLPKDTVLPAKIGLHMIKPVIAEGKNGQKNKGILVRGAGLSEAITEELTRQWLQKQGRRGDESVYPQERGVLYRLCDYMAHTQSISQSEAFNKLARAYFNPHEFSKLVKELSGREVQGNNITYSRPHFVSLLFGLMNYEQLKRDNGYPGGYSLSTAFIEDRLTPRQKQEILTNLPILQLRPSVESYIKTQWSQQQQLPQAA